MGINSFWFWAKKVDLTWGLAILQNLSAVWLEAHRDGPLKSSFY